MKIEHKILKNNNYIFTAKFFKIIKNKKNIT